MILRFQGASAASTPDVYPYLFHHWQFKSGESFTAQRVEGIVINAHLTDLINTANNSNASVNTGVTVQKKCHWQKRTLEEFNAKTG